jgi:AmiR/NasT family two-component response regulator
MARQRVFVIWTNPLFYESIRLLLSNEVDLVGSTDDHALGEREIAKLKPEVVIIETPEGLEDLEAETISILEKGARVIHLSLKDNELNLFSRQHKTMDEPNDLLQMILKGGDRNQDSNGNVHE